MFPIFLDWWKQTIPPCSMRSRGAPKSWHCFDKPFTLWPPRLQLCAKAKCKVWWFFTLVCTCWIKSMDDKYRMSESDWTFMVGGSEVGEKGRIFNCFHAHTALVRSFIIRQEQGKIVVGVLRGITEMSTIIKQAEKPRLWLKWNVSFIVVCQIVSFWYILGGILQFDFSFENLIFCRVFGEVGWWKDKTTRSFSLETRAIVKNLKRLEGNTDP